MKIGMSSMGFALTEENFKRLSENKIDAVEISMASDKYKDIDYKEVKALADSHNVNLWSYHLPFTPFEEIDPSAIDKSVRKNAVEYFGELIKKASNIGIDKLIIHPSGEPIDALEREERINGSMESLDKLAEIASHEGAVICVEDLPRTCLGNCADDILRLISANEKLRVCFDTNHLLEDDNLNFIEKVGDKIVTVHVSDYDFVNERHWLPGEGKIDWQKLYSALVEKGYNGVWMYEIALKCPKTIIRDCDLDFSDFYKNAHEIFEGKELTVIGRQKENLGFWE